MNYKDISDIHLDERDQIIIKTLKDQWTGDYMMGIRDNLEEMYGWGDGLTDSQLIYGVIRPFIVDLYFELMTLKLIVPDALRSIALGYVDREKTIEKMCVDIMTMQIGYWFEGEGEWVNLLQDVRDTEIRREK